ncbi:hypothetical protein [Bdellovibrio svalbardensis]|uniref:Uncharacterized protein n=1 Tax=Bdellovibrio svalbardensis TaxID=2972972 RepID=A0ABT6DM75_9BACT|nr:hypothetical protein [Bdellovibrio svalbardensis]MDG0817976.1 hypothetical protein [Bdellovibrio svalbardensis]
MKYFLVIVSSLFCLCAKANTPDRWSVTFNGAEKFSLNDSSSGKEKNYSISFFRGHNELMNLPAREEIWLKWRQRLTALSQRNLESKHCLTPLIFSIERKNQGTLIKRICLKENSPDATEAKNILIEFNGYLYGK